MTDEGRIVDERVRRIEECLVLHPETRSTGLRRPINADRMETMNVPGVSVAVVNEGALEWARGYRVREAGTSDPVTPETLFRCCSISKMVAALGALRLVVEGRVELDDDVNDHLRSWKVPRTGDWQPRVTLRHLLSHTAGISLRGGAGGAGGAAGGDRVGARVLSVTGTTEEVLPHGAERGAVDLPLLDSLWQVTVDPELRLGSRRRD
jgi:CubicO group peptidase (beta-lactamase class C family)